MMVDNYPMNAAMNYNNYIENQTSKLYYFGQQQPFNIFNPFAWGQFIKAWKDGKFKRKKYKDDKKEQQNKIVQQRRIFIIILLSVLVLFSIIVIFLVRSHYRLKEKKTTLEKKNLDGAMNLFNEALAILPDYDDAINNRGVVYYRKGLISDAQKTWELLASKKPDYAVASYNIGLVYIHEHQYDAAERLFERALKANKSFVEAWVRYGYLQMQTGKKEKG